MPIYRYKCSVCDHEQDEYRSVAERDRFPTCAADCDPEDLGEDEEDMQWTCKGEMRRIVAAPMVITDMQPYKSMVTGEMITSRSQHRAHLKAHNCIEIGNETNYLKPKEKIDLTPESKKARKQKIIDQVNALK